MRFRLLSYISFFLFPVMLCAQSKYVPPSPYGILENRQHFSKYLIVSPGYFGPNALPVPRLTDGRVKEKLWIDLEYEQYSGTNELTYDVFTDIHIPIANGKVSLEFYYVPYEFYSVDYELSRERRSQSGEALNGSAQGDVYFGTHVQLIRGHRWIPDFAFGMTGRTASGTKAEDVRYTNAQIRWFALVGFYVWQTYLDDYPQNDALLYGAGVELKYGRISLLNSIRGYNGYMHNGDHPLIYRSEVGLSEGAASLILGYEYGIRDYPFSCFRAGFRINGLSDKE
ncbi:MAG: hypothetical protein KAH17_03900 [Bacteroidales bacterium]|nr:hypothetical protein [Bacteroidales bacterium]